MAVKMRERVCEWGIWRQKKRMKKNLAGKKYGIGYARVIDALQRGLLNYGGIRAMICAPD